MKKIKNNKKIVNLESSLRSNDNPFLNTFLFRPIY